MKGTGFSPYVSIRKQDRLQPLRERFSASLLGVAGELPVGAFSPLRGMGGRPDLRDFLNLKTNKSRRSGVCRGVRQEVAQRSWEREVKESL